MISTMRRSVRQSPKNLSFILVSHVAFTGHSQELKTYLEANSDKLLFIGHPFSYAEQKTSIAQFYEKKTLKHEIKAPQYRGPEYLLYIKDIFTTLYFFARFHRRFDFYIGADPLNAIVGVFLKKIGLTRKTVFYVIDYVPVRFGNPVLNSAYHAIDKICVYHSDYTWNLTNAMSEARQKMGIKKENTYQMTVPTGTHIRNYKTSEPTKNNTIVFLSHLRKGQGIELVLDALPKIIKKIPTVNLAVIGTGPLEDFFRDEVRKRGLKRNVTFYGYIKDHSEIERIVAASSVGLAPYVPDSNSFTWYADPGKPKVYLGCGIPVVITRVPEVSLEISKHNAGIMINYDPYELSEAVLKILQDEKLSNEYRKNARQFASRLDWNAVYHDAFSKIL